MSQNEEGMVPLGKERVKSHGVTPEEEGERDGLSILPGH